MNKILTFIVFALLAVAASAVPAKPGTFTVVQSDGTTLTLSMLGDEFFHGYVTLDRRAVGVDAKGDYYYRDANGLTPVMAHDPLQRSQAEADYVAQRGDEITLAATVTPHAQARRARAEAARKRTQVPTLNSPHIPIILVNYPDIRFKSDDPVETFRGRISEGEFSCYQYFVDQSRGKFTPQFDVIGLVELDSVRAYYGQNDSRGDDQNLGHMVVEAVQGIGEGFDPALYDNDGDGEVDVVIVLYAGVGEAQAYRIVPTAVWPCQWDLFSSEYGKVLEVGDYIVNRFAVFCELAGSRDSGTKLDGIGTFCHEFSHCLGLPDYYPTNYGSGYGMGNWSLLDNGCYANDGDTPVGYSGYDRNFMGWLDYETPVEGTTYVLDPLNTDSGKAIKVTNPANSDEYYILENRQKTGWDAYLPGSGLMVNHIDFNQTSWDNNTVNNVSSHQRMTIIPADNQLTTYTEANDLFPYGNLDSLTNNSKPAAKVFKGGYMNQPITEITRVGNQISLVYMKRAFEKKAPELTDTTGVGSDGFTAHWTAEDNALSYTLSVRNTDISSLVKEVFPASKFSGMTSTDISGSLDNYMDNPGWTGSALYTDTGAIRLGKSLGTGTLVSPGFDLTGTDGKLTVFMTAGNFGTDSDCEMTISCGSAAETLNIPANSPEKYKVVLNASASAGQKVTLATTVAGKRVLISNLEIIQGETDRAIDSLSRVVAEITDTCYTVGGLAKGSYEVKVKAVYSDGDSEWSAPWTVSLHESAPAGDVNNDGIVDITDLNIVVNIILGLDDAANYDGRADVLANGIVDISDLNELINIILGL